MQRHTAQQASRQRPADVRQRGVITLELIIVLPILVIASVAILEFGILSLVQQAVTTSAIEGAREAAKVGMTVDDIAETVQNYLAVHKIIFDTTGTSGGDARVVIEHPDLGVADRGDLTIPCTPNGPPLAPDEVRITVCARVTDANGDHPVPDWLCNFGFSLDGCVFEISSRSNLE